MSRTTLSCLLLGLLFALPLQAQPQGSESTIGVRTRAHVYLPPYAAQALGSWGVEYLVDYQYRPHQLPGLTLAALLGGQTRAFRQYSFRHHIDLPDNPLMQRRMESMAFNAHGQVQYTPAPFQSSRFRPYLGLGIGLQYAWVRDRIWDGVLVNNSARRHWHQLIPVADLALGVRFHDAYHVDRWGFELSFFQGLEAERAPNRMRWDASLKDYTPTFARTAQYRSVAVGVFYALVIRKKQE